MKSSATKTVWWCYNTN